jgi:CBS domain-containing protein
MVKDIMTKDVITLRETDTVSEAGKIMLEKRISGLPVVNDEGELVGIVSEADLIYREGNVHLPTFIPIMDGVIFLESMKKVEGQIKKMIGYKVRDVMTKNVIIVKENTTVEEAARIMMDKKVNRLPVMRNKKIVGIVTRADILKAITS